MFFIDGFFFQLVCGEKGEKMITLDTVPAYQYFSFVDPVYVKQLFMYRVGVIIGIIFASFVWIPFVVLGFTRRKLP